MFNYHFHGSTTIKLQNSSNSMTPVLFVSISLMTASSSFSSQAIPSFASRPAISLMVRAPLLSRSKVLNISLKTYSSWLLLAMVVSLWRINLMMCLTLSFLTGASRSSTTPIHVFSRWATKYSSLGT